MTETPDKPAEQPDEYSLTRQQFCELEHISSSTYFKLRRTGHGPEEVKFPGTAVVRITAEARRQWHRHTEEYRQTLAAKLEASRRTEKATERGKKAARSERHVSKRRAKV